MFEVILRKAISKTSGKFCFLVMCSLATGIKYVDRARFTYMHYSTGALWLRNCWSCSYLNLRPAFSLSLFSQLLPVSSSRLSHSLRHFRLYILLKVLSFLFFPSTTAEVSWQNVRTILPASDVFCSYWDQLRCGYAVHLVNYSTEALRLRSRCCNPSLSLLSPSSLGFSLSLRV